MSENRAGEYRRLRDQWWEAARDKEAAYFETGVAELVDPWIEEPDWQDALSAAGGDEPFAFDALVMFCEANGLGGTDLDPRCHEAPVRPRPGWARGIPGTAVSGVAA